MSETPASPVFLVDAYSDPVIVRIEGRASFLNCSCLREFVQRMLAEGKKRFVVDFQRCTSMDSTFLGLLAGIAIDLRKRKPEGGIVLARVGARNLELIRNLGLHRLIPVDGSDLPAGTPGAGVPAGSGKDTPLSCGRQSEIDHARLVLEAHENLVGVDESNRAKFQDVLTFMRSRVDQG